jgi:hypothetical protein
LDGFTEEQVASLYESGYLLPGSSRITNNPQAIKAAQIDPVLLAEGVKSQITAMSMEDVHGQSNLFNTGGWKSRRREGQTKET